MPSVNKRPESKPQPRGIELVPNRAIEGRVPPQAIDVEAKVVGAMLLDRLAIAQVIAVLDAEAFHADYHRKIFQAIIALYDRSEPADLTTVAEELRRSGNLELVGGEAYLADLTMQVTSIANVEFHAKIVLEKSLLRQIITATSSIAMRGYSPSEDVFELLDEGQQILFDIAGRKVQKGFIGSNAAMHKTLEYLETLHGTKSGLVGVPTGYPNLDLLTGGWRNSNFIVIAGRPSSGKTAFALAMTRNAALHHDKPTGVGFFSLEMSTEELMIRLSTAEARVNSTALQQGRLSEDGWKQLTLAAPKIAGAPIWVDDSAEMTILELRAKARRLKSEKNIGLIVVDYLQLMSGNKHFETREKEIASISRGLKALAKELAIPVIGLSQLSRAVDGRQNKRPILSDLRESGAIEQDADVVAFVHRPEMYLEHDSKNYDAVKGKAEIIVAKQRNGPIDTVKLTFIHQYAKFENLAPTGFSGGAPPERYEQDDQPF